MFCLIKSQAEKLKQAIRNGEFNPNKLFEMKSSEEARDYFAKWVGEENAREVNLLYEKRLLLKNQEQAQLNFFKEILGDKEFLEQKEELTKKAQERAEERKDKIYNPKENERFLGEIVNEAYSRKFKEDITLEESNTLYEFYRQTSKLKEEYNPETKIWSSKEARLKFGITNRLYENYVKDLKFEDMGLKETLKDYSHEISIKWKTDKLTTVKQIISDSIKVSFDTLTSAVGSWDNSSIGRQGVITLIKSPKIWWEMSQNSVKNFYDVIKFGKDKAKIIEDFAWADINSRPNAMEGWYKEADLFPKKEEAFPISVPAEVPIVGRAFKASETSFKISTMEARANLFDLMAKMYEATGKKIDSEIAQDIGTSVLAITARGRLGRFGGSEVISRLLWAPKMIKADWDILTGHTFGMGLKTNFVRKQSAKTIIGLVIATAGITAIAEAMGADVEKDPRSSDFLKIRVGNTRFSSPFLRGIPQLVTLFTRLLTQSTKDTTTGFISELNSGKYGSKTLFDVGLDYLINKTNPAVRAGITLAKGKDISGKEPTFGSMFGGFLPISIQNLIGLKDEMSLPAAFGVLTDFFGISSNTYSRETDWNQNTTQELGEFKSIIGQESFNQANKEYNDLLNENLFSLVATKKYQLLNDDDKREEVADLKELVKDTIFNKYAPQEYEAPKESLFDLNYKAEDQYSFFDDILTYAEAVKLDPVEAFDKIFSGDRIISVDTRSGIIRVNRMLKEESEAIKAESGKQTKEWKLDHIIPLEMGGDNDRNNLMLVPTEAWESWTNQENSITQDLIDGKITKTEAWKMIMDIKKDYIK